MLTEQAFKAIVALIPDDWLVEDSPFDNPEQHRVAYTHFLVTRVAESSFFVNEAQHARETAI